MVQQQRFAVFTFSVGLAAFALFAALLPRIGWIRAQSGFSILAVWAAGPFLFRRGGRAVGDERLRSIHLRSIQISQAILWMLFVAGLMSAYYDYREHGPVNIEIFPLIVWIGTASLLCVHSAVVLVLHRVM
jgi:hypothetical protein